MNPFKLGDLVEFIGSPKLGKNTGLIVGGIYKVNKVSGQGISLEIRKPYCYSQVIWEAFKPVNPEEILIRWLKGE